MRPGGVMIVSAVSDKKRIVITDEEGWDGTLTFSRGQGGKIEVAADQDHAQDSYNETISNTYTLPRKIAVDLLLWLGDALR
jgi:hypothetical protein